MFLAVSLSGQSIEPSAIVSNSNYYDLEVQGLSLHSSLGELAISYLDDGQNGLSQGFLQTYVDLVPVVEVGLPGLSLQLGPNPCVDQLTLRQNLQLPLQVELWDVYGRRLKSLPFESVSITISMSDLPAGNYFLQALQAGRPVFQTMKVVKL